MWGPEVDKEALKGSLWGDDPKLVRQLEGYREQDIPKYGHSIRTYIGALEAAARQYLRASIELEAYSEDLRRERDAARNEALDEAVRKVWGVWRTRRDLTDEARDAIKDRIDSCRDNPNGQT